MTLARWILLLAACEAEPGSRPDAAASGDAAVDVAADAGEDDAAVDAGLDGGVDFPPEITLGGDRPAPMHLPADYDGAPLPLVILLHGYTIDGQVQDQYFGLSARVDARRFFLILPDGTREASAAMNRFWNATDACCNFYGSTVDDVAYLVGLVAEARSLVSVSRVYVVGHSNGGFMAYRLACDAADGIDAVVSLAGATFFDETDCSASRPVSVLQIHGTLDATILYGGVASGPMRYPGAEETVRRWAERAACGTTTSTGTPIDLDSVILGDETEVVRHDGCPVPLDVELWRIRNGAHVPTLAPGFADRVLDWAFAH